MMNYHYCVKEFMNVILVADTMIREEMIEILMSKCDRILSQHQK